ncbi:MAG: hypothetical protein WBE92_03455 [Steroidobacteraceae bacterium]
MPMEVLLGLSLVASLLVVRLGPRASTVRELKPFRVELRLRPPAAFLWTRVALLVLSAALLVMALAKQWPAR